VKSEAQAGALLFSWFSLHTRSEGGTARNEFAACPDFITDFDALRLVSRGDERRPVEQRSLFRDPQMVVCKSQILRKRLNEHRNSNQRSP
jgi:hypothetical protein